MEPESVVVLMAVLVDILISGFIIYSGGKQHDRIEGKVDAIMNHIGINSKDEKEES